MKEINSPQAIFKKDGDLCITTATSNAKVIYYKKLENKEKCPHCGKELDIEFSAVESSPNFQESVEPVATITNNQ